MVQSVADELGKLGSDSQKKTFEEQVKHAKKVDILSVADALGIDIQKKGRSLRGVENESLTFYTTTNSFYWFSQEIGGSPIDLVQLYTDKTYQQAVSFLNTEDLIESTVEISIPEKKPFYYYIKETDDFSRAADYLINTRKIDEKIVQRLHDEGYLSQGLYMPFYPENKDLYPCVVAKWERKNKLVGGTIQGLTYDPESYGKRGRDKKIMANSESNFGWNYTIGHPKQIIFCESFIDLLSYWSMNPNLTDCMLVDLEGLKSETVKEFLKELIIEKKGSYENGIIFGIDNDIEAQKMVDKMYDFKFTEGAEFKLAQPFNNAVTKENMLIYRRVATEYNVDPVAIATVHKAFTNAELVTKLSNPWKNDQFFGKNLKPNEEHTKMNLVVECRKVAIELANVKQPDGSYDFNLLSSQNSNNKDYKKMGTKLNRIYSMYQKEGIAVREEILKDQNDVLKSSVNADKEAIQSKGEQQMEPLQVDSEEKELPNTQRENQIEESLQNESDNITETSTFTISTEDFARIQNNLKLDFEKIEAEFLQLPAKELLLRSEEYVAYKDIVEVAESLSQSTPNKSFIDALLSSETPVTDLYKVVKESPLLLHDHDYVSTEFQTQFVDLMKEGLNSPLNEYENEKIDLILENIKQEISDIPGEDITSQQELRLEMQKEFLKQTLIAEGLLVNTETLLQVTPLVEGLNEKNHIKQICLSYVNDLDVSLFEFNQNIAQIETLENLVEPFETTIGYQLDAFKNWAQNYEGVGKEYIPEEIQSLSINEAGKIELSDQEYWFDSLNDYLISYKDDTFGQSAAIENARVLIKYMDSDDRGIHVLNNQLETQQQNFLETVETIPEEVSALYDNALVSMDNVTGKTEDKPIPTIIVTSPFEKSTLAFPSISSFEDYVTSTYEKEIEKTALKNQHENLSSELAAIVEWTERYKGLDTEYIPYKEIHFLQIQQNEEKKYVIRDVMEDGFVRDYKTIEAYLNSYEGNVWEDTQSYKSVQTYFSNRLDKDKCDYEIVTQNFLATKQNALQEIAAHPELFDQKQATIWENMFVVDFENWDTGKQNKLIYFQDPTRVGNPLFFESEEKVHEFVNKQAPKIEKQATGIGLFRRENTENKSRFFPKNEEKGEQKNQEQTMILNDAPSKQVSTNKSVTLKEKNVAPKTSKELLDQVKEGVKEFLDSDKFKNYLQVMGNFHSYSWKNTMLIYQQKPDASYVAGFQTWKNKFNRQVQKGEKGIKILAPVKTKQEKEIDEVVNGKTEKVKKEVQTVTGVRPVSVFDISQTEGDPLPELITELNGNVKNYETLFKAIAATTKYNIVFEEIDGGARGYCNFTENKIALKTGMSEVHTIKTLIHEITHSHLHNPDQRKEREHSDRRTMEVEAESTAFVVCSHFNLDTSDYSFGYIATWGSGKDLTEITQSFSTIQSQADKMINSINGNLEELAKEIDQEKGVTPKLKAAREKSDQHNENVKKSQPQQEQKKNMKQEKGK